MDALIVFAKVPRAGAVKTRLAPVLSPEEAARLYGAFLRDALAAYAALDHEAPGEAAREVAVRLYLAGPLEALPPDLVPDGVTIHRQQGNGLGARMQHAFVETFAAGAERAVVIGTDHPTLPPAFVRLAFDVLDAPLSVCLGPSHDGGYYLLGMNDLFPELFRGMTYSHPHVFEETVERAAGAAARISVLPGWYDVDTPAALERLADELRLDGEAAPHTRRALAELDLLES